MDRRVKKYIIVGMPSSGKTTIGKFVAAELGFRFFDLDGVIVEEEKKEISEIFKENGENHFRSLEKKFLDQLLAIDESFVLSVGGGAPCFYDNMQKLNEAGVTIFLDVPVEDLFAKLLKKGTKKRPLLRGKDKGELLEELQNKYETRLPFYSQSKLHLRQRFSSVNDRAIEVLEAIFKLEEQTQG